MSESFYYEAAPTYFVTMSGTLAVSANPTFDIPQFHRREQDTEDNKIVRVHLQNISGQQEYLLGVFDESNTLCKVISTIFPPQMIVTDQKLKLGAPSTSTGAASFLAMVFYRKPSER